MAKQWHWDTPFQETPICEIYNTSLQLGAAISGNLYMNWWAFTIDLDFSKTMVVRQSTNASLVVWGVQSWEFLNYGIVPWATPIGNPFPWWRKIMVSCEMAFDDLTNGASRHDFFAVSLGISNWREGQGFKGLRASIFWQLPDTWDGLAFRHGMLLTLEDWSCSFSCLKTGILQVFSDESKLSTPPFFLVISS